MPADSARHSGLHPLAWWVWALGVAVATTRSPGLASTAMLIAALVLVVSLCRGDSPYARAFRGYLLLAGAVVMIRTIFHILVGIKGGGSVVLPLPRIPLPSWAGGIELLGPVSAPGLMSAISSGLALAALLLCFGAAIALTDPQRTLRSLPASLHLLGTATVIALTLAPQLIGSWHRVRRAQGLRGLHLRGWRAVAATTSPVLQDALDHSLTIAASMDSRGYARTHGSSSPVVLALMLVALLGAALGGYALLDGTAPRWLSAPLLGGGALAALLGSFIASRRIRTTRYRPERWALGESLVAGSGLAVAVLVTLAPTAVTAAGQTGFIGWSPIFLLAALTACAPIPVVLAS
jgi:energy-coupling factor transport system permease protein